ncbi:hypothetical protein CMV_008958 [Castanea mollissima]|uniref:PB1-like domain-containing protein n=1 Tax=Castanea mollissima TaxID=60419 RepID=A0A8J4RLU0_9ROSI|nr:hypothetical protein CMV_008958 [Castanea mollissima]
MDDFDFTITLYYWGKIRNNPYRYEGGEIKIYEDNNSDEMSLVEIWNKAKNFGYGENDVFMYRVPTTPFAGGLKPLENDVDVMNMVKCIRGYNEVEVYVMFLDDYENAIGIEGDGEDGDNEGGNLDEGDKVDGAVSEEDSAHKVHFGCSESDDDDMFAQYISSGEIASKVKGLPNETLCLRKDKQVKLKEGRKRKASASGVSPSRVGGSGVDPSGVGQSEVGASGVGPSGIDARGVDPTWVDASRVNPSASALVAFGADRDEDKWESETSASLVSSSDDETRPRYPQYHPPESFSEVHFELEMQFATKKDVMDAIKLYSIFKGVPMKDEDTWIVKKLNPEHNCGRRLRNRFASSNWLGKHLVDDVRSDPNVKMSVIRDRVVNKFKVHISRYQASRAKGRAKELVHGTFTEQYAQLGDYCEELLRSNPGMESLTQTYGSCIYPISGPKLWPQSDRETILPPKKIRQGGRPKKKRKKELGELNNPYKMKRRIGHVKCSQCGTVGHNKRRCNPATQASKQLRVRLVIVREPNVTAHGLENQEHGTSSSQVEPTNRAAPPPQTREEAYASQHSQKMPVRKRNVTSQSQPTPQCEGVHRSQPAS